MSQRGEIVLNIYGYITSKSGGVKAGIVWETIVDKLQLSHQVFDRHIIWNSHFDVDKYTDKASPFAVVNLIFTCTTLKSLVPFTLLNFLLS